MGIEDVLLVCLSNMASRSTNNKIHALIKYYIYYYTVSFPVTTNPRNGIRSRHINNIMIAHNASGI